VIDLTILSIGIIYRNLIITFIFYGWQGLRDLDRYDGVLIIMINSQRVRNRTNLSNEN